MLTWVITIALLAALAFLGWFVQRDHARERSKRVEFKCAVCKTMRVLEKKSLRDKVWNREPLAWTCGNCGVRHDLVLENNWYVKRQRAWLMKSEQVNAQLAAKNGKPSLKAVK